MAMMMLKIAARALALTCLFCASAVAQEREWSLDQSDGEAFLTFGVADTEDVGLSLWCDMKSDIIDLYLPVNDEAKKPGESFPIRISAKSTVSEVKGTVAEDHNSGLLGLEAKLSVGDPVFAAMLDADRFKVKVAEDENVYPLLEADLSGLLAVCRKG